MNQKRWRLVNVHEVGGPAKGKGVLCVLVGLFGSYCLRTVNLLLHWAVCKTY